jgi:putative exosortase-associated protein (TIGR04073 family)
MRLTRAVLTLLAVASLGLVGCSGPEKKLGRGFMNMTEFARGGEIRRSVEQSALWDGADSAYTTGVFRGFNRSMARTFVGAYEVLTFPFPSYDPNPKIAYMLSPNPLFPNMAPSYPDSFKPGLMEDQTFAPDISLGFAGGDVVPMVPGSRFRVFDN